MRIKQAFAIGLLALTPALTGCLVHTHSVLKTRLPEIVYGASLDQLLKQVDERYANVQTMQAYVQVVACTGGSRKGEVTCYPPFSGFIIIGKPEQISVILKVPILSSEALNMVSDGKSFKMRVPPEKCAIVGSDVVTNSSQKGLYALRPAVILDSLMIQPREDDQLVAMTQDSRTLPDPKTHKDVIEEPDYDLQFLSQPEGKVARSLRVIHIGRSTLLPYQQDIYNSDGKVETQAAYSAYQKFGDVNFPSKIVIQRPLDDLTLTITLNKKTTFNLKLDADTFNMPPVPENYAVQNMDDPVSAATNPCGAHAPPPKH
jgi:outer membrane lipoprotein-sorting protein